MQVIVQVVEGTGAGRKLWLRPGQTAEFGRVDWVDFSVPDPLLADVHFALHCDGRHCWVKDISGGAGLKLNGQPIGEAYVKNGDKLTAGRTTFGLSIDGGAPLPEGAAVAAAPAVAPPPVNPAVLQAETNYRKTLATFDQYGGPNSDFVELRHLYSELLVGLANILEMQGRKPEAQLLRQQADKILRDPEVKKYLEQKAR